MRFSLAFTIALCASPLGLCPVLAQTGAGIGSAALRPTQILLPSQSSWGRPLTPLQARVRAGQSLQARDRAFGYLEDQAGAVEPPNFNLLGGAGDLEGWTWNRYRSVTENQTLTPRQREAMIAGVVHQDLQLAEAGLERGDPSVRRRALRVASIATLYSGMLNDDPRLRSALYEGFLLPHLEVAPPRGWSGASALLEGASMAYRLSGRVQERREVLLTLLERQVAAGDARNADTTRIHLADAFAAEGYYQNAIDTLGAVTSPDLEGARDVLREFGTTLRATQQENRIAWEDAHRAVIEARNGRGGIAPVAANTPDNALGNATAAGAANAGAPGAVTGQAAPGIGAVIGGAGGALGAGGGATNANGGATGNGAGGATGAAKGAANAGEGADTETGAAPSDVRPGESEKMRRVRLAAEAAQRAQELSKDAQEKATIALALLLDASDAQAALEDAEAGRAPVAPKRQRTANAVGTPAVAGAPAADAAPPVNLIALRQNAQRLALRASEAAGAAKRASIAAQKASEEAANLALRVFIVDHDAPKTAPAPATLAPVDDVPVARAATNEVQPAAPTVRQAAPANPTQTEAPTP